MLQPIQLIGQPRCWAQPQVRGGQGLVATSLRRSDWLNELARPVLRYLLHYFASSLPVCCHKPGRRET